MKENNDTLSLIKKAKTGDLDSLEKLLKETEKEIYSFLYYLSNSKEDVSDMVQEILLKITKNIKYLKDAGNFKAWVNKIAIRHYYDKLRKKKTEKVDICELEEDKSPKDKKREPIEECIGCEIIEGIKQSVCKLPEPYRAAILMREFRGMSYDEIAKLTKTNVGTVKSRIARARSRLKEYIKPYVE